MQLAAAVNFVVPMKSHLIRVLLSISMVLFPFLVFSQLPYSPCSPTGGKKANILGVETKYRAPGGGAPTFTIPAGTQSIVVFVSSETGDLSTGVEPERGDEDFITINAIIDIPSSTSSGFINYAKSTFTNGSGTNVYGWRDVILGAQIPNGSKIGDKTPDLNNVNFSISGSTLTIAENATGINSSFYVEYLSPATNSFDPLPTEIRALLHGATSLNTDLVIPIPAGASLLTISGKGINSSNADLNSANGTEEGYSSMHMTIDLDAGLTNGIVTLANGGTVDRRSTYVISNLSSTSTSDMVSSGAITGDYTTKNSGTGAVGLYDPQIYVSGSNLIIKRDAAYARDFDDAYTVEFYKRVGQGMSAEFIDNDIRSIPASSYPASGVTRTFKIPSGTHFIYLNQTANAINLSVESNENSLAAYGYIDLSTETATGYYYQQVGSNTGTGRREDNYAFKDVPLDSTSTHDHVNTVGFRAGFPYDLRFTLSQDKSELIVTNQTGLASQTYQFLLSADFFGARPDLAFNPPNITFSKGASCKQLKVTVNVCNPGAGNATGGMPISFYNGDPTVNPAAVLIHIDTLDQPIKVGECKNFTFDVDLSSISTPTLDLTMIINDEGTFVPGGLGHAVGTPFALSALDTRNPYYRECYYDNNIFTKTVNVNNCPVIDPDPDKSSGATGDYTYLNSFTAGSATPAKIADADLTIISPDASDIYGATITLTNILDAGQEGVYLTGTLPAGITISGDGTGVVTLSGRASQADYIAAIKMLGYKNTNITPNTADRIITTTLSDGTESGLVATTTIKVLTNPGINVTGNSITIPDNSTTSNTADGTDFGQTTGATIAHSFTIQNSGTGTLTLTGTPLVSVSGDPGFTVTAQPATGSLNGGANTTFEITFDPASHSAGIYNATITIKNSDADADKADYTFVVSVGTNRLPTVTDGSVSGNEDNTLVFTNTDFTGHYTDADASPLDKIKIVSLPQHGILMLNGSAVAAGQEIPAADLGNITFVPDAEWSGSTSFDWVASDGTGYAATPATMTININPVNDAPVLTVPAGATVNEETATPIPGISATDIDAGTGIVTVTISVPSGGFSATSGSGVTVSGTPGALVLAGTLTDINAFIAGNNLNYTSAHNPPASVTATVNVSDNGNTGTGGALQDTKTFPILITSVNTPPTGTGDTRVTTRNVPVNGSVSGTDPDGDVLTFTKATDPAHGSVVVNMDGTYTYTPAAGYIGTDNFTITISDGQGGTTTVTVDITVNPPANNPPTGTGDSKTTTKDVPVGGAVSGTDPDGDPLTFTKATDPAHGSAVVNPDGTYIYTPAAGYIGTDNFTVTISDGNGGTATVTVNITVNPTPNNPPTGTGDAKTTIRDTPVNGAVSGTDPDGDALAFTKDTDPAHGSVIVNADGTYTYTPAAGYTGTDNFTILISDGKGGTTTVTVNITVNAPPNNPPTGTGDTETTIQDTPVNGAVSGTDPDGDALTFTKDTDPAHGSVVVNTDGTYTYTPAAGYTGTDQFTIIISDGKGGTATVTVDITINPRPNTPPTGTGDTKTTNQDTPVNGSVSGTDPDGDALNFTKATDPTHGSVVVNADGTYTYTPAAGYTGADNFTITISDGKGGTTTVTVNIIVNPVVPTNNPPTGTGDTKTTIRDTPVNGSVSGTDPDGDALSFTKGTDPAHGSVLVNTDGTYTYTPAAGYTGTDNFTIVISDGKGGTTTVTVNITVNPVVPANNPPTGTGDTKVTTVDTPVDGSVSGTDPDGDALTYSIGTDPSNGSIIFSSDGTYTYTPNPGYIGTDNFTVIISDGRGGTKIVTVNITVNPVAPPNNPPIGTGDSRTTTQDTPVSGIVSGMDPDGDALTFTKGADVLHGSVVVNSDGTYTYTPAAGYTGTDNFTVNISDGKGGTVTVTVNITVNPVVAPGNNPPTGTGDTKTTNQDTPVNGSVSGTDPDGDALTFTKGTDPAHGSVVVNTDGTYTYTPAAGYTGIDNFTIIISDGNGGTATVTVNITVSPVAPANNPPTGTGDVKATEQDTPVSGAVSGTDPDGDALTFTKGTDPAHGTVVVNPDGTYTYAPAAGYSGADNFTIIISDGKGGTTTVIVNITVTVKTTTPPVAADDKAETKANTAVTIEVLTNDNAGNSSLDTESLAIVGQPAHGTVKVNEDGMIVYTPDAGYTGEDVFTYHVANTSGQFSNTATVRITITLSTINVPNLFTPNGDGKNDAFEIRGLNQYYENELIIVNRWGNEVYRQKGYQNTWKGEGLNEGTYYYLLRIRRNADAEWEVMKGYITLIRSFKQ